MRVIAGEFRSRRIKTLPGLALRPTPDRLREALFNVLAPRIAGVTFLDAYAGSGSVGIEALSCGASACWPMATMQSASSWYPECDTPTAKPWQGGGNGSVTLRAWRTVILK